MEESIQEDTVIVLPNGKTFPRKVYSAYTVEELKEVIGCCYSIKGITNTLKVHASYSKYIKQFILQNNVSIAHFEKREGSTEGMMTRMVKDSTGINTGRLKEFILKNELLKNECAVCSLGPTWNDKPLSLQLDHINGNHYDNRLENLRMICPNCHTQTDTFTGKNKRKYERRVCSNCNATIATNNTSGKCKQCLDPTKKDDKCITCNIKKRKRGGYVQCADCKSQNKKKMCKKCNKPITRITNVFDYHNDCHKGIERQKTEEL